MFIFLLSIIYIVKRDVKRDIILKLNMNYSDYGKDIFIHELNLRVGKIYRQQNNISRQRVYICQTTGIFYHIHNGYLL